MLDTTIVEIPEDKKYEDDGDVWVAKEAERMGFPIAGFARDIYEDAVILVPGLFKFDWTPEKVKIGRVLSVTHHEFEDHPTDFILMLEDGTQVPKTLGTSYPIHFALPEDSEEFCRG